MTVGSWPAVETVRAAIGAGDRLVPGTVSQQEADALHALARLQALCKAAEAAYAYLPKQPHKAQRLLEAALDGLAA